MSLLGDFQTPPELAASVVAACRSRGFSPARILEPTCGSGAFLRAASDAFPAAEVVGVEYQRERYGSELDTFARATPRATIYYADAYAFDFGALPWRDAGPLLVVGNPPWITAAALGRATQPVLQPPRSNQTRLRGLAARTGAANFDVAEFLLLKLITECATQAGALHFALLVKESVARKVIVGAACAAARVTHAEIVRIDARKWFGAAVDACCFFASMTVDTSPTRPIVAWNGRAGAATRIAPPASAAPAGAIVFRQGIKHDAADVFELHRADGGWRNGYGETVDVESAYVYPLRKARALHSGRCEMTALIVPQRRLGDPTAVLATRAPRLWRYLHAHAARIAARKSSIYRNAPPFAIFGIGPYSFALWKVGVAGLYAQPRFRLIGPEDGRPVMLGDTAYFAGFDSEAEARACLVLVESPAAAAALAERIVRGKRPVTKALLDAVDWDASCGAPAPNSISLAIREESAL